MALTSAQISSRLFKKSLGAAETLVNKNFFEEPKLGKMAIMPSQIWAEADLIPTTAPVLSDGESSGVVKYYDKLSLTFITGSVSGTSDVSYYHDNLKDAIPFNWGDSVSYFYKLYKSDGTTQIAFGVGDWLVDGDAGVLTFYGTLPAGVSSSNPPKISFYQYIGKKGLIASGSTGGISVHDVVKVSTSSGETISNYDNNTSGYTSLPASIDGYSSFLEGDRILIKNQTDLIQNGIFQVSGTTLVRALDHDGTPTNEVAVGDYVFVLSGNTNAYTGWVLDSTNGNPQEIIPGVNTQHWTFFSASQSYTADGKALQLIGNQFKVVLDESGINGSGLEQNTTNGLRIKPALLSTIESVSGTPSAILSLESVVNDLTGTTISLSTELSTTSSMTLSLEQSLSGLTSTVTQEISTLTSVTDSLETSINDISGLTTSISNNLSTETSQRLSSDESLETYINNVTGLTNSLSIELSTEISIRSSAVTSLENALDNFSGVTSQTAGSGLTFNTSEQSLNVNTDNVTIKIINDELRTPILWIQTDRMTTILSGTTGSTNITLTYEPVGHVSAYVNGIEYLVSVSGGTSITPDMPFYFDNFPANQGDVLKYDSNVSGFGLESNIDLIVIKYHYIDETII